VPMTIRRLIRQLLSAFLLLDIIRRYEGRAALMKIKAAQVYVLGVKKIRVFFLGALGVLVSFALLINGVSLIQSAVFTYSMWSNEVKFTVALCMGGIEFLGAIGLLLYLFREEIWGHFFGIDHVVNLAIDQEDQDNKR